METVLGHIRDDTLTPNAEVIHFLLQGSDALTHLIQYMDHSDNIDISGPVAALESIRPNAENHSDTRAHSTGAPLLTMGSIRSLNRHQMLTPASLNPASLKPVLTRPR